jgi:hypothetical protein
MKRWWIALVVGALMLAGASTGLQAAGDDWPGGASRLIYLAGDDWPGGS